MVYMRCVFDIAVEWTSPMNRVVDNYAYYKSEPGVKECLGYVPVPPRYKPRTQQRGREVGELLGSRQLSAEQLTQARRAYRFLVSVLSLTFADFLNIWT